MLPHLKIANADQIDNGILGQLAWVRIVWSPFAGGSPCRRAHMISLGVDVENCTEHPVSTHGPLDASGVPLPGCVQITSRINVMAIERMLTEVEPVGELIGRVLQYFWPPIAESHQSSMPRAP
jgi:hypothetical protein